MTPDSLAQLRPLHLPEPVGWWPPAPGWWVLAAGVLVLLAAGAVVLWRRRRRNRYRREALRELHRAATAAGDGAALHEFCAAAATILRRAALTRYPREQVARLCGEAWLRFLDRSGAMQGFADGAGRALLDAPYDPAARGDARELERLCRQWLRRHR